LPALQRRKRIGTERAKVKVKVLWPGAGVTGYSFTQNAKQTQSDFGYGQARLCLIFWYFAVE